jgi:hypothetical protein
VIHNITHTRADNSLTVKPPVAVATILLASWWLRACLSCRLWCACAMRSLMVDIVLSIDMKVGAASWRLQCNARTTAVNSMN